MIPAILYALFFTWLIYRHGLFGLTDQDRQGRRLATFAFAVKLFAIPVFYLVYEHHYGGLKGFDSGKFYHDVEQLYRCCADRPSLLLRLLTGIEPGPELLEHYRACIAGTYNWDDGTVKDFLYNDNRVLIRVHLLLHFIAFGSYGAHAVFSCLMSFIGIYHIYRSFREFYAGKEPALLLVVCLYPALWFYTGGFLKEGLTLLVLGCTIHELKLLFSEGLSFRRLWLALLLGIAFFLKPYLLLWSAACFGLFFFIYYAGTRRKIVSFLVLISVLIIAANMAALHFKQRSLTGAALRQRALFAGAARGGIFLTGHDRYIRLSYDSSQVRRLNDSAYKINFGVAYSYHEDSHHLDTLYCAYNTDTLSVYRLAYMAPPANSNLAYDPNEKGWQVLLRSLPQCFALTLPGSDRSFTVLAASAENLLLLVSFMLILVSMFTVKKRKFLPFVFVFFGLTICCLVTVTSPNTGAIFRYRAPAAVFIIMGALYLLPVPFRKQDPG